MLGQVDPAARPGDVVAVYDKSGLLFGQALFNPRSQIVLRMLTWGDTPADDTFWNGAIARALVLRRDLHLDEITDAYRLIHAEGDGLSGLIVERYADCLVFEVFSLGMFQRYAHLATILKDSLGAPTRPDRPTTANAQWRVVLRADARTTQIEGFRPPPAEPVGNVTIREHGIRYQVDVVSGHKTGFFCDQRDNRARFAELCRDARVLDVCCYTGGFGLCAKVLGQAKDVTSVDIDDAALALARRNVNLNGARVQLVRSDAFVYLRQMIENGRQYDAVVLDPPKLATTRDDIDDALRKYHDLNHLAAHLVRPAGVLLSCSCSGLVPPARFTETVHHAIRHAGRTAQLFDHTGAAPDHPVMLNCPESAYLKALWLRIL